MVPHRFLWSSRRPSVYLLFRHFRPPGWPNAPWIEDHNIFARNLEISFSSSGRADLRLVSVLGMVVH